MSRDPVHERDVSVVLPVYNEERFLPEAIESLLESAYDNLEIIVVDDGSEDSSREIAERYARSDGRIRVHAQANAGISRALNRGIELAGNDLVARMDADDVVLPDRFRPQVEYLESHPDCMMVGGQVFLIDAAGRLVRNSGVPSGDARGMMTGVPLTHDEIDEALLAGSWPVVHPAIMVRREAVRRVGGYDPRYESIEDFDLFVRLAEIGRLANLPEPVLKYRRHVRQVTASNDGSWSAKREIIRGAKLRRMSRVERAYHTARRRARGLLKRL